MKRLIVNADDFGITRGVNRGILRCYQDGIVTSTTIMANGDAFEDAVELARANPGLGVGVHLVLVGGCAVARREEISSLADENGQLPPTLSSLIRKCNLGRVPARQIECELRAQIERVRSAGITPTHLDTHKHAHMDPWIMKALTRVAGECGISRVRMPFEDISSAFGPVGGNGGGSIARRLFVVASLMSYPAFRYFVRRSQMHSPDHFFGFVVTGRLDGDTLLRILRHLPEGTSELMCHPGINDSDLQKQGTRLMAQRETELNALIDPSARKAISERGVRIISYRDLNQGNG
ncbi:MAG: ChbG/HpnK family deacetylase [Candidatus Acidiferrales bacterium]